MLRQRMQVLRLKSILTRGEERGGRSQRSWAAVVSTVNALVEVRIPRVDLGLAGAAISGLPSVFTKIIRDGRQR